MRDAMFAFIAFVVIPDNGHDWITNAKASGAMIVWIGGVLLALTIIAKVRLRKGRSATRMRPARAAVTIGSAIGSVFSYFLKPVARFVGDVVQDAVEPLIDTLRTENTEQHAETSARLTAVEEAVDKLTSRMDAVESVRALDH